MALAYGGSARLVFPKNNIGANASIPDIVSRADGKLLVTWNDVTNVYVSTIASEYVFTRNNDTLETSKQTIYAFGAAMNQNYPLSSLVRKPNNEILLFIYEPGVLNDATKPQKVMVYKSANGLGTDFAYYATVMSNSLAGLTTYTREASRSVGRPLILPSGRILVTHMAMLAYGGTYAKPYQYVSYSDNGTTWTNVRLSLGDWHYDDEEEPAISIGKCGSQLVVAHTTRSGGGYQFGFFLSASNGASWSFSGFKAQNNAWDGGNGQVIWGRDGYTYYKYCDGVEIWKSKIYYRADNLDLPAGNCFGVGPGQTWSGPIWNTAYGDDGYDRFVRDGLDLQCGHFLGFAWDLGTARMYNYNDDFWPKENTNAALILGPSEVAPVGTYIPDYQTEFNEGSIAGWTQENYSGSGRTWSVSSGQPDNYLECTNGSYNDLSFMLKDSYSMTNGTIEADAQCISNQTQVWSGPMLMFRYQDNINYYRLLLFNDGTVEFVRYVAGSKTVLATANAGVNGFSKNNMKLIVNGSNFKCYINGVYICEANDATFATGRFGVASYEMVVRFYNLKVTSTKTPNTRVASIYK